MMPKRESLKTKSSYREHCQYHSGAEVVIENVVAFVWADEARDDVAAVAFPLLSTVTAKQKA